LKPQRQLEKVGVFHGLKDYYSRPKKLNCYPFKIAKSPFLNHGWSCDSETSTYVHVFQLKVRFNRMNHFCHSPFLLSIFEDLKVGS
jgi:putative IMPACT (imprinted ancient) family translation regulator